MMIVLALVLCSLLVFTIGRRLLPALPLLLYIPIPLLYYGYILQQQRERYFVGLSAVLILLIAWLGAELWRRRPTQTTRLALATTIVTIVALNTGEAISFYQKKLIEPEQTQPTAYQAALWIRDYLPSSAVIGAKNSGIYQYYSDHVVLNIDGKLNHEIVPVMERRELLDYLRARGVMYLVDREQIMADHIAFYSHQFGPAPQHRTPSLFERVVIYGKMIANTLGAQRPLNLDDQRGWSPTRSFDTAAEIVKRFRRPTQSTDPVVIYRMKPTNAAGVP